MRETNEYFPEEERSKQPSVFSVIRTIVNLFFAEGDPQLGLYGAFGYDLTFQFEPIDLRNERPESQRDVVLYLPDNILVVDQDKRSAWRLQYDFIWGDKSSTGLPRTGSEVILLWIDHTVLAYTNSSLWRLTLAISTDRFRISRVVS